MPLSTGTRLGPYEIVAPLGAGGMGEVYKARDTRLDRIVALKVLASSMAADPQLRERFEREARAISSLNHPNICVLHDVGRERPQPAQSSGAGGASAAPPSSGEDAAVDFLVMEYLEGETLAARLARGPARATRGASVTRTSTKADSPSDPADRPAGSALLSPSVTPPPFDFAQGRPMTVDEALGIAIQVAAALDRAHRQGIVHRDLKPGNVMLTKSARPGSPPGGASTSSAHVKLLDFGLARLTRAFRDAEKKDGLGHGLASLADLSMPTVSSPLTMKGTILGTLQYMAPEQLEGKDIDARADIFAFGAVLYEMLTGRRPFEGKSQASLIGAVLDHTPTPVTSFQPEVPPLLEETVARCLAKDPEERWQTARDLMRQLEWIAARSGAPVATVAHAVGERPGMRARILRASAALLGVAAIAGGAVAWVLWPKPSAPAVVSRFTIDLPEGQAFTRAGRRVVAVSPDGARLVYVANQQLYLRNMNELTATPISGTAGTDPSEPIFSPDGQWVAFWSSNALKKVPIAGGTPITLGAAENPAGASWAGDRILLGQTTPSGIVEVPANGGTPNLLVAVDDKKQELAQSPQLLAGGGAVLFTLRTGNQAWDDSVVVVQDLASGRRTVLVNGGTDAHVLPTGHLVYAREATLFAMPFDETRLSVTGGAVPLQQGVQLATGGFSGAAQVAWSNSGVMVFIPDGFAQDRRLVWVDRQGQSERAPVPNRRYQPGSSEMRVSPDGTRVALTILSDASSGQSRAGQDIWLWEIARGTLTRLSFTSQSSSPVWTPDGRRVCYEGAFDVFCQSADGSGQPEAMFKMDRLISLGPISPDGKWMLLHVQGSSAQSDISMAAIGTPTETRPLLQTPAIEGNSALSPDGRWLAYTSNESGTTEVYVRPFPAVDQGRWQISTGGGFDPHWASHGRELFFLDIGGSAGATNARAVMSVPLQLGTSFIPGKPISVMKFPAGAGRGFAVAPDGRFLFNLPASSTDNEQAARAQLVVVQHWFEELKARVPTMGANR